MAAACQSVQEPNELRPYDDRDPAVGGGQVLLPRQASSAPPLEMSLSSGSARALKIHSEAERRRRERINAHLASLRRMIPDTEQNLTFVGKFQMIILIYLSVTVGHNIRRTLKLAATGQPLSTQMDKATLLARVVDQVKCLKRRAKEATRLTPPVPPETDDVSVECYTGDDVCMYMKASVSCDDRPDLLAGLVRALHDLRLRTVRAEVASIGGRVQHVFTLCSQEEDGGGARCVVGVGSMKEAVRQALAKVASPELVYGSSSSSLSFQSKRQRILESHCSIMSV
ncbi:unnamed protein product [Alopecurus aequalis]